MGVHGLTVLLSRFSLAEILVLAGTVGAGEWHHQPVLGSLLGLNVFRDTCFTRECGSPQVAHDARGAARHGAGRQARPVAPQAPRSRLNLIATLRRRGSQDLLSVKSL